jgi:hypothetical protein
MTLLPLEVESGSKITCACDLPFELLSLAFLEYFLLTLSSLVLLPFEATLELRLRAILRLELLAQGSLPLALLRLA